MMIDARALRYVERARWLRERRERYSQARTMEQVRRLAEAQNWRCAYCYLRLSFRTTTRDHVVPRSRGGSRGWANLVASCRWCNETKRDREVDEFLRSPELLRRRLQVAIGLVRSAA
jgi:5-methylcytosine-specific restriction endonuclease McrA